MREDFSTEPRKTEHVPVQKVIIYGNQAVAAEAHYILSLSNAHQVVAFTVDANLIQEARLHDLPVVPFTEIERAYPPAEHAILVAVGYTKNNRIRADRYQLALEKGYTPTKAIAPTAIIASSAEIGANCIIGHQSTISPNTRIGNDVIVGNHCSIGHDSVLADHCFLSNDVAISGRVTVGEFSYLGTNCTIRNKIRIGTRCVIGAGALILENTPDTSVFLGAGATQLPISSDDLQLG